MSARIIPFPRRPVPDPGPAAPPTAAVVPLPVLGARPAVPARPDRPVTPRRAVRRGLAVRDGDGVRVEWDAGRGVPVAVCAACCVSFDALTLDQAYGWAGVHRCDPELAELLAEMTGRAS